MLYKPQHRVKDKRYYHSEGSWIWKYGADIIDGKGNKWFLCRACHLAEKYGNDLFAMKSTSSAASHLRNHHGASKDREPTAVKRREDIMQLMQPFDGKEWINSYIDWVLLLDLSYTQATHPTSMAMLTWASSQLRKVFPAASSTLSLWIKDRFEQRLPQVIKLLQEAPSKINISIDIWKASNSREYVGVVGDFVNHYGTKQTALLGLPRLIGSHSGENVANAIAPIIERFQIQEKLGAFIADNAGDMQHTVEQLSIHFPCIQPSRDRLRCAGHVLNLIVKALLFGKGVSKFQRVLRGAADVQAFEAWSKKGPIGRLHNIATWVNRNDARRQRLRERILSIAELRNESKPFYHVLLSDGGVRWNSVYTMILRGE